jgi:hypothetical protein
MATIEAENRRYEEILQKDQSKLTKQEIADLEAIQASRDRRGHTYGSLGEIVFTAFDEPPQMKKLPKHQCEMVRNASVKQISDGMQNYEASKDIPEEDQYSPLTSSAAATIQSAIVDRCTAGQTGGGGHSSRSAHSRSAHSRSAHSHTDHPAHKCSEIFGKKMCLEHLAAYLHNNTQRTEQALKKAGFADREEALQCWHELTHGMKKELKTLVPPKVYDRMFGEYLRSHTSN